ncbi:hypothetical protein SLEP1_g10832 [Rubroshorea leprosula]|uniref:Uncharacterized protein n=1 Tax=Rubroshorea leprosula TaxID=152421 RepID=A0AAV5IIS4_9ROSI|nr:hypothetical protein SLEP1_g10832 [Rubroshorea leprosula]
MGLNMRWWWNHKQVILGFHAGSSDSISHSHLDHDWLGFAQLTANT